MLPRLGHSSFGQNIDHIVDAHLAGTYAPTGQRDGPSQQERIRGGEQGAWSVLVLKQYVPGRAEERNGFDSMGLLDFRRGGRSGGYHLYVVLLSGGRDSESSRVGMARRYGRPNVSF